MASVLIREIAVVDCDDWIGLYVNGELKLEGHGRGRPADILAFGAKHCPYTAKLYFADAQEGEAEWLVGGSMPSRLSDIPNLQQDVPCAELAAQ